MVKDTSGEKERQRVFSNVVYDLTLNGEDVGRGFYLGQLPGRKTKMSHEILYRTPEGVARSWRFEDRHYSLEGKALDISGGQPDPTEWASGLWSNMLSKQGL